MNRNEAIEKLRKLNKNWWEVYDQLIEAEMEDKEALKLELNRLTEKCNQIHVFLLKNK